MAEELQLETEIRAEPTHIYYKLTGVLTLESLINAAMEIDIISKQSSILKVVADYREVIFEINMASVFEIPDQLENVGMPIGAQTAVLYHKDVAASEKFEMYKILAHSKGHIIELFNDHKKALQWLAKQ